MPSTDSPNWWADVQQEREDLAGPGRRPADDWLGEDIDFVPRRRMTRDRASAAAAAPAAPSVITPLDDRLATAERARAAHDPETADHALHGVFVPAPHAPVSASTRTVELTGDVDRPAAGTRTIELLTGDDAAHGAHAHAGRDRPVPAAVAHELAHLSAADDPFATPPPPAGSRRTVQIKGRPTESRLASVTQRSMAQRHRGRTTSDRVGHRPDRIALWAVALGAILILLAAMTSSSQAAVRHARPAAPAAAKVAHVTATHTTLSTTLRLSR
jgi:hypothetical protein